MKVHELITALSSLDQELDIFVGDNKGRTEITQVEHIKEHSRDFIKINISDDSLDDYDNRVILSMKDMKLYQKDCDAIEEIRDIVEAL